MPNITDIASSGPYDRDDLRLSALYHAQRMAVLITDATDYSVSAEDDEIDTVTVLGDFLCDFMHLCAAVDVDFEHVVDRARYHFDPEQKGEL